MRLDHIAYRVKDRKKTAEFFINAFGYKIQTEFDLQFPDGSTAKCIALEPPEKKQNGVHWIVQHLFVAIKEFGYPEPEPIKEVLQEYHLPAEIFISDGSPESIVGQWVARRDNVGGIHHIAFQVESVSNTMKEWKEKGYAEFSSEEPLTCPGITQVFTKPSELTGVIYEFIEREEFGFCKDNVKNLMLSTKDNK